MKIYLFSDHTGMVESRVVPEFKTNVTVIGNVNQGSITIGSKTYEIRDGYARVPIEAFDAETVTVVITAKEKGKIRNWPCGKLTRSKTDGSYAPVHMDGNTALLKARVLIDELFDLVKAQDAEIKKIKERSSKKFLGGNES